MVDVPECSCIIKEAALAGVYTDSCCTEGHVKRDTAYCGYIWSFVCNLLTFIENSMSRLRNWSCRRTRLWVGGRRYRDSILCRRNFSVSRFLRRHIALICQELYDLLECVSLNHLNTNRRPLYLKTQSVPRCKHFSSRL